MYFKPDDTVFLSKIFDVENFKKYKNFYTLIDNTITTYKRIYPVTNEDIIINRFMRYETLVIYKDLGKPKPEWLVLGVKRQIKPIYGHFITNDNYFIYMDINKSYKPLYNIKYMKKPFNKFLKPINDNYYQFYDITDLKNSYLPIKKYEDDKYYESIKNREAYIQSLIDYFNEFDPLLEDLYSYDNEKITSYINQDILRIYLNGERI